LYRVRPWWNWIWFAVGGIPPLAVAGAYNFAIFGTPLPVSYEYSALWQDVHRIGFLSLTLPQADALWGITFGAYRGLFLLSPFLLLAFPGLYFFWREKNYRAEFWVVAWAIASFFLFNGSSAMWSGGFAVGPRYLVPALPFLAFPIAFFLSAMKSRGARILFWMLALVSVALVWIETIGGQSFPQYDPIPLIQYSLPRIAAGDIARNFGMILGLRGIPSLIPLALFLIALGGIAWAREKGYWQRSAKLVESQS
jgi:hypothetical protein